MHSTSTDLYHVLNTHVRSHRRIIQEHQHSSISFPELELNPSVHELSMWPLLKSALKTKRHRDVKDRWIIWGRGAWIASVASASVSFTFQGRSRRVFQFSTFDRLSSFFFKNLQLSRLHQWTWLEAVSSRVVSKMPSIIQLWLHFTCNCSCYRRTIADGFSKFCNELLSSTSRASPRWNGKQRSLPHFQSKFQSSRLSLHLTYDLNKCKRQQSRSLERYDRWLSITLPYRSAIPMSTQQRHLSRRDILTHSFFSETGWCIHSSFHIFRNHDEQFVLCHFVVVIVIFYATKLQVAYSIVTGASSSSRPDSRLWCLPVIPRARSCPDATCSSTSSLLGPRPTTTTLDRWTSIASSSTSAFAISFSISMLSSIVSDDYVGGQLWALPTLAIGLTSFRVSKTSDCCFACIEHDSWLLQVRKCCWILLYSM